MQEQLRYRLDELKVEFEKGQKQLQDLETQAATMRQTLLRISGAIQVLEEELAKADEPLNVGAES
jgi:predicted  nucleic acid-binding Zn-ribbon protein